MLQLQLMGGQLMIEMDSIGPPIPATGADVAGA